MMRDALNVAIYVVGDISSMFWNTSYAENSKSCILAWQQHYFSCGVKTSPMNCIEGDEKSDVNLSTTTTVADIITASQNQMSVSVCVIAKLKCFPHSFCVSLCSQGFTLGTRKKHLFEQIFAACKNIILPMWEWVVSDAQVCWHRAPLWDVYFSPALYVFYWRPLLVGVISQCVWIQSYSFNYVLKYVDALTWYILIACRLKIVWGYIHAHSQRKHLNYIAPFWHFSPNNPPDLFCSVCMCMFCVWNVCVCGHVWACVCMCVPW